MEGRVAMTVFRPGQALPWHPGGEPPHEEGKDAMIAQLALWTPLGPREVRPDQCMELRGGELDGNGRGGRVLCSCAHGVLASGAAGGRYLLKQVSPNTTIA
jgi:hypothetical protein